MSKFLSRYAAAMDRVSVFIGHACSALFFACIAFSALEVVMRYGFDHPTSWSIELTMALCAMAWVLSVGYVTERNRHISITMLELMVGPRVWHWFRLMQILAAIVTVSVFAMAVWDPALRVFSRPEYSGTALNSIQPSLLKVLILVGAILYVLQLLANLIRWVQGTEKASTHGH